MNFFTQLFGSDSKVSRSQARTRSQRRRRAAIVVESLEGRRLPSASIPGVSLSGGVINIAATQPSGNTATVSTDSSNGNVKVTLNGNSVEYNAGSIWTLTYTGSQGGGDSFANNTSLTESVTMYGGNNTTLGGSTWNVVALWGDNNTYNARGGPSDVFAYNGPDDNIVPYSNVSVSASSFIMWSSPTPTPTPTPSPSPTPTPTPAPTPTPTAPTVNWTSPAAITSGTALSATQLDATASVPGTFTYSPAAGTVLPAGQNDALSVTFTPTDTTDYTSVTASTTINVQSPPPVTPAISTTPIAGVSLSGGDLSITATQGSGNTAVVSTDPTNGMLTVTLNGQSVEYNPGSVWTVTYTGSQGGGDSFTNNTSITETVTMYGGNNTTLGGTTWNIVKLWGANNTYDARGGPSDVFTYNASNDDIVPYSNVSVFATTFIAWA